MIYKKISWLIGPDQIEKNINFPFWKPMWRRWKDKVTNLGKTFVIHMSYKGLVYIKIVETKTCYEMN